MKTLSPETVKMLHDVLEGSFDGILIADGNGVVLTINSSYSRNTGLYEKDLIGKKIGDYINPVWMKQSAVVEAIKQRKTVSIRHDTQNIKDIIATGTPMFDENGDVWLVVVNTRDISEIAFLKDELAKTKKMESMYRAQLSNDIAPTLLDGRIVICDDEMRRIYEKAGKIAPYDVSVLVTGESGVGKEFVADYIHRKSPTRSSKKFITVNCAAIPENLVESELFGYVGGAFTGAKAQGKEGLFEAADGGTVLLDEIGELKPDLQTKLLRVLETRTVTRVGDSASIPLDIRIIAATNRDLKKDVADGKFREDLYYRISVVELNLPPLRERRTEINALSLRFLEIFNKKYGLNKRITPEILEEFQNHEWNGNIRELKNVIENMVVLSGHEYLQMSDIPWLMRTEEISPDGADDGTLQSGVSLSEMTAYFEKRVLSEAKKKYGSSRKMAEALKTDPSTIVRKLNKYGIK